MRVCVFRLVFYYGLFIGVNIELGLYFETASLQIGDRQGFLQSCNLSLSFLEEIDVIRVKDNESSKLDFEELIVDVVHRSIWRYDAKKISFTNNQRYYFSY